MFPVYRHVVKRQNYGNIDSKVAVFNINKIKTYKPMHSLPLSWFVGIALLRQRMILSVFNHFCIVHAQISDLFIFNLKVKTIVPKNQIVLVVRF